MINPKRKRLYVDIETSHNVGLFFRTGTKRNISHKDILDERQIICIGYKWAHQKKVHCIEWDFKAKKGMRDKKILTDFSQVYAEADEVVTQNGDKFDIKWIQGRMAILRLPPLTPIPQLDMLKLNRKHFNWNCHKQDYVDHLMGGTGKIPMDGLDWKRIEINNDRKILKKMMDYCKKDVLDLERDFTMLEPYYIGKMNKHYEGLHGSSCSVCNLGILTKSGWYTYEEKAPRRKYKCNHCGKMRIDSRELKEDLYEKRVYE